ncbi:NfeD family protein [Flavisphingomonas formosensis]|uniref:NfeD family protein n=1 Tax=Flavisphingomonas formosensis TaxID=861534 RepID=UPI0012F798D5|nr:NfeD family protein [Sphingomonas formosensis]
MTIDGIAIDPQWCWLTAGVLLGIAEVIAPGFFLIWLGVAALVTGTVTLAFGIPIEAQFALFAVIAIAAVYAARRWFLANPGPTGDPLLNDRAARLIGQTVLVVAAIEGGEGRVKVGDGVWNAEGPDMPEGTRVRVTGATGTTLLVERLN